MELHNLWTKFQLASACFRLLPWLHVFTPVANSTIYRPFKREVLVRTSPACTATTNRHKLNCKFSTYRYLQSYNSGSRLTTVVVLRECFLHGQVEFYIPGTKSCHTKNHPERTATNRSLWRCVIRGITSVIASTSKELNLRTRPS